MNCPSCGTENPERARFCMSCGSGAAVPVPQLRGREPAAGEVLHRVRSRAGTAGAPPAARAPAEEQLPEERRKATILFADLSGYTAVAERLDPEAVKSLVDRALRRLGDEVERYGGTIDKYIGDNVMGVFGAPIAHEDDPERAVRAGLAMQAAMERDQRADRRRHRRRLQAPGRDQLRRGAGGAGRRRLHGDRRPGQRRRAAAGAPPSRAR